MLSELAPTTQSAPGFNFSEVFWQKTSVLFGFYWLFRWLMPELLPESLRAADFQTQMLVCAVGGLVFTALAALGRHVGSGQTTNAQK
jgi:hypothetical protein